jgi:hypothetical protein
MFQGLTLRRSLYGAAIAGLLAGVAVKRGLARFGGIGSVARMEEKLAPVIALSHGGGEFGLFVCETSTVG